VAINVSAEVDINAAPADIAAVMFDPAREGEWVSVVTGVEMLDKALKPGARVRHSANVAGQTVSVVTVVETVHFPHVLALRIAEGSVEGGIRFDIQRSGSGSRVRVRGTVEPGGALGFIPPSMIEGPATSMVQQDLTRLKAIVERG
jgi:carbon monoxide dehydrogenase subunit G